MEFETVKGWPGGASEEAAGTSWHGGGRNERGPTIMNECGRKIQGEEGDEEEEGKGD